MKNKKNKKLIMSAMLVFSCVMIIGSMKVFAQTASVNGTLNYRMLDGSANGKYYSIGAGKRVTISGKVSKTGYNSKEVEKNAYGQYVGTQATYINLYELNNSGKGVKVCGTSVSVSSGSVPYSATGTTSYENKKYMYIYKPMNDGYDLSISGTITY